MRKLLVTVPALVLGLQFCAFADVIPTGAEIEVRTDTPIELRSWERGRIYSAHVDRDIVARDGDVSIPRGAPAELIVREAGPHEMVLDLESVTVNGRRYVVDAASPEFNTRARQGLGENGRTGRFVGGGAILGTIIGAIAGGGKGAAIGALTGAAGGAGAQVLTRGGEIRVPAESQLTFRLQAPMHVADWREPGYDQNGNHYHRQNDWYR